MTSTCILYLEGRLDEENANQFEITIESSICIFVLVYCDIEIHACFVDTHDVYPCTVPLLKLSNIKHQCLTSEIYESHASGCCFPAIKAEREKTHIAGLCAVLRWIIKLHLDLYPNHHSSDLLGFRGGCLVACTESSVWTKFCELQLPDAVREVSSVTKNGTLCKEIPKNLAILEAHMKQPVRTHNILKRKLDIAKKVIQTSSEMESNGVPADTSGISSVLDINFTLLNDAAKNRNAIKIINLPQQLKNMTITEKSDDFCLNHSFIEGIDLTLADMIIFPCVHYLLNNLPSQAAIFLENVSKWYTKMTSNILVRNAAEKCGCFMNKINENHNIGLTVEDIIFPDVDQISLYTRDTCHSKKKYKKHNPGHILCILKVAEIHPVYAQNCCSQLQWNSLPAMLHPATGDLPTKRVNRKCQQLESMVTAVLKVAKAGQTIVEFCAGGGHVGLILAHHLPNCKIILVENKESSMMRARTRAKALDLKNVMFFQCNLDYFKGAFDIGVSLHACGVATDLVIQQCIAQQSAFVCCPCCYGGVQNTHLLCYPLSKKFQNSGLSYKDYTFLAHCADRTEVNTPTAEQGEICMGLIDTDRVYKAEEHGYKVALTTLQPVSCSPKHNLLIGTPMSWNSIYTK